MLPDIHKKADVTTKSQFGRRTDSIDEDISGLYRSGINLGPNNTAVKNVSKT